jgi:thiamine-monophosphate kinase
MEYCSAKSIAMKAISANLSDIAAMGGRPLYIMLGFAIPAHVDQRWMKEFSISFSKYCKEYNVIVIGGDTTASASGLFISITCIGEVHIENIKYRNQAKINDFIYVTGELGDSHAGLLLQGEGIKDEHHETVINKHLFPEAKVKIGEWLGKQFCVHAMMDISDGLYIDLSRMIKASGDGATLTLESLPISAAVRALAQEYGWDPVKIALEGGEDYQLLFTVSEANATAFEKRFFEEFKYHVPKIGQITHNHQITLLQNNSPVKMAIKPFSHFGEES